MGGYVLDFYCAAAALCVEVDGKGHEMGSNPQRDARPDAWVAERGIRTIRIPAEEILRDIEPVLTLIGQECTSRSPAKSSPGFPGGGRPRSEAAWWRGHFRRQEAPPPACGWSPSPAFAGEE
jgi:Protein of unknown function (DUF559)